ncbi:MAG TPA: hypothetical protein VFG83_14535, partial [Kofleriaceae bacterium]|nr:hypothetical protein [Kofleriaceae bacterium]
MRFQVNAARGSVAFALITAFVIAGSGSAYSQPADPSATGDNPAADSTADPAATPTADPAATPTADPAATPTADPAAPAASAEVPLVIRLRTLEQKVQALKERAWRAKARVGMLKEAVLGGGIGARASIVHVNDMGNAFRLTKLVYALDGTQIFSRYDTTGTLDDQDTLEILSGPIAPGSHTISVLAVYTGHGYGVFKYLNDYKFTVRSSHTFSATEGVGSSIRVHAYEKGGATTP